MQFRVESSQDIIFFVLEITVAGGFRAYPLSAES